VEVVDIRLCGHKYRTYMGEGMETERTEHIEKREKEEI